MHFCQITCGNDSGFMQLSIDKKVVTCLHMESKSVLRIPPQVSGNRSFLPSTSRTRDPITEGKGTPCTVCSHIYPIHYPVIVTHRITSHHLNLVLQKLLQINIILAKIYFRGLPNFGNLFWWRVGVSLESDVNWGVRLVGLTLLLLFCNESLEDLINPLLRLSITCPDVWEIKAMS